MKSFSLRALLPLILFLVGALTAGPSLRVERQGFSGPDVYQRACAATAWVHSADNGKGTGWVLDRSRGWLVTCYHVVGENDTVEVIFPVRRRGRLITERNDYIEQRQRLRDSGHALRGRVLRRDPNTDLALVELGSLPAGVTELPLAVNSAAPGDGVHVVGNRYDSDSLWLHTSGSVRQVKTLREGYFNGGRQLAKGARIVVAQAPINEGDSGAALVNERGEVVGVAAAVAWEMHGAGLFLDVGAVRALAGSANSPSQVAQADRSVGAEVYRQSLRSLALVQSAPQRRAAGVVLDRSRRLLLTTFEVVTRDQPLTVTFPVFQAGRPVAEIAFYREQHRLLQSKGVQVQGCVLASDARRNLALVELAAVPDTVQDAKFAVAPPSPGESLHALGHPLRMEVLWVYTAASVRQLGHANLGQTRDGPDPTVLIVQAPLGEGDGGGLLLNDRRELVGIVSGKSAPQQQICFGLAVEEIQAFLAESRLHWKPQTALEWCQRGVLFTRARQYDRAIDDFTQAIHLDPANAPACSERAWAHYLRGAADLALADCEKALQLDPGLATAYCHRAAVRSAKGQTAQTVADCDTALRLDPRLARAHSIRGRAHLLQGDAARAVLDCDEAIWLDRRLPEAHLYRGQAFAHKGDHDRAIADYTQALQLDPRLAEAFRCRGDSYWARSDVAASFADHDQAVALDPHDARAYFGRGRALAARNEIERAVADYTRVLQLQPRLLVEVLTEVERCGAELSRGGTENIARCCELCHRMLVAVRPLFEGRAQVQKIITRGLAAAERETDLTQRVACLRTVLAEVRKSE